MKDLGSQPVYPVQLGTRHKDGASIFENDVVGGLTVREYVAIEFAKHMFGNPALLNSSAAILRKSAIEQAGKFISELSESETPVPDPVYSGPRRLDDTDLKPTEIKEVGNEEGEEHG